MSRRYILATAAFVLAAAGVWLVPARASTDIEQAVIIHFSYGSTNFKPVFALQERLEKTLAESGAGEVDGNELATSGKDGYLYLYGPSADRVLEAALPVLQTAPFMNGAMVTRVYGRLGTNVRRVESTIAF
jgi:hypothetical protein